MSIPKVSDLKIDCSYCPIRHRAVCARCEPDELQTLNDIKFYKSVPAGQVIATQGEQLDVVASIVSGVATLSQSLADGRTQMTGLMLPSDFIGRPGREVVQHEITAVTDLTLCCFHRKPFEKLMSVTPHVQERLLEMALDELDAARDWMLLLGRKTAQERIASFLHLILKRQMDPNSANDAPHRVDLPISRESMANYLGLTIETVSRQMSALRKAGTISLEGARAVIVPDIHRLETAAGIAD